MCFRIAAIVALALFSGACSIRPLPEDVTGAQYDTYEIVKRIRCEMRAAIITYVKRSIRRHEGDAVADALEGKPDVLADLYRNRKRLSPVFQKLVDRYDGAMITYDFTFDITENNNILASADLGKTITRGTFGVGFIGTSDRERHNTRNFRISDNFLKLVVEKKDSFCEEKNIHTVDWVYPIKGSLNLREMVGAFLDLNQSGNLTGKDKDPPALSDNIQFVTRFSGSIHPSFEFSPITRNFEVARAGITATGIREDKHSVIVVLTLPPEDTAPKVAAVDQQRVAEDHIIRQRVIKNNSDLGDIARELRVLR